MDARVERLDAAAEHLGHLGQLLDRASPARPIFCRNAAGAAARDELASRARRARARTSSRPVLVVDGDQRARITDQLSDDLRQAAGARPPARGPSATRRRRRAAPARARRRSRGRCRRPRRRSARSPRSPARRPRARRRSGARRETRAAAPECVFTIRSGKRVEEAARAAGACTRRRRPRSTPCSVEPVGHRRVARLAVVELVELEGGGRDAGRLCPLERARAGAGC